MTLVARFVARLLLLPLLMVSLAVLFKGYVDIGDGFSAGVIAALAFILQAVAFGPQEFDRLPVARYAIFVAFVGLGLALTTAFVPPLLGYPIMTHFPRAGESVIHFGFIEIFTPLVFDIGVFLIVVGFCTASISAVSRQIAWQERHPESAVAVSEGDAT